MIPHTGKTIDDYQWKNRLVISNFENRVIDSLLGGSEKERVERKLLFVEFQNDKFIKITGEQEIESTSFLKVLSQTNPNSEWALIGLDGGVKATGTYREFSLEKIFQLIDQMPMRQSEIDQ